MIEFTENGKMYNPADGIWHCQKEGDFIIIIKHKTRLFVTTKDGLVSKGFYTTTLLSSIFDTLRWTGWQWECIG